MAAEQIVSSARSKNRAIKCVEARRSAAAAIGPIEPGLSVFAVTRGQFSMIDCIQHALAEMGPCRVTVWTWCIADYEVETFEWLLRQGTITSALLVIDRAGEQQVSKSRSFRPGARPKSEANQGLMRRWKERFGADSIRVCLNHAKICTLDNGVLKLTIRGSMNLNHNPRFEQLDVTEGPEVFGVVHEIEEGLPVLAENYTLAEVERATGAHSLFTSDQLKPFQAKGLKVWAK